MEIQTNFIPGTNIPRPRDREPYETDDHYVQEYLIKEYYSKYFPEEVEKYIKENPEKFKDINIENIKNTNPNHQNVTPYTFSLEQPDDNIIIEEEVDNEEEKTISTTEESLIEEDNFAGENQEIIDVTPDTKDLVSKKHEKNFIQKTKEFLKSIGKKIEKVHYLLHPLDYDDFETGNFDLEDYEVADSVATVKRR